MKRFHFCAVLFAAFICFQSTSTPNALAQETNEESTIAVDFAFQQYILPSSADLSIPAVSVSWHDWIVQGRYNYESRDAASVWLGRTFSFGESSGSDDPWELALTPMVGGIMGSIHGVAPGGLIEVEWRRFQFYSEFEYVFDSSSREENFFYSWTQLTFGVTDWLYLGIVGNRTRSYDSAVEIDRGPIVETQFDWGTLSFTALNIDSNAIYVLGAEIPFEL